MPMAEVMKELRDRYGLSQPGFAELVAERGGDLPAGTLSSVETGRRNMSVERIEQLVTALKLGAEDRARLLAARQEQAEIQSRSVSARLDRIEARLDALEDEAGLSDSAGADVVSLREERLGLAAEQPFAADEDEDGELAGRSEAPTEFPI